MPLVDTLSDRSVVVHCRAELALVVQLYPWGLVAHWHAPWGPWLPVRVGRC